MLLGSGTPLGATPDTTRVPSTKPKVLRKYVPSTSPVGGTVFAKSAPCTHGKNTVSTNPATGLIVTLLIDGQLPKALPLEFRVMPVVNVVGRSITAVFGSSRVHESEVGLPVLKL